MQHQLLLSKVTQYHYCNCLWTNRLPDEMQKFTILPKATCLFLIFEAKNTHHKDKVKVAKKTCYFPHHQIGSVIH